MKRLVLLLTAVVLLAFSAAFAEESAPVPDLMDLYRVDGDELEWIGNAVPFSEGIAVAPAGLLPENLSDVRISDGTNLWEPMTAATDRSGVLAVMVYDADAAPKAIGKF